MYRFGKRREWAGYPFYNTLTDVGNVEKGGRARNVIVNQARTLFAVWNKLQGELMLA